MVVDVSRWVRYVVDGGGWWWIVVVQVGVKWSGGRCVCFWVRVWGKGVSRRAKRRGDSNECVSELHMLEKFAGEHLHEEM